MNIEYVKSEKFWRAPDLDVEDSGLGKAILEKLKQIDPERVLEVLHESGTHVTVKDTREQTITVAQNLINLGVKKYNNVVVFSMLNLKITPITFACYTIGAPICFFETYLEEENYSHYIELLDPTVIIYEEQFKSKIFKALKVLNLPNLKHIFSIDGEKQSIDELLFKPTVDIESFQVPDIGDPTETPAILAFTSGTTGMPKIIMQSHSMMRQGVYSRWQAKPGSVVTILSEIRWLCQVSIMMQPVFLDVKRIYCRTPPKELTGEFIRELIDTHKVTHYFEVPNMYMTVLEAAEMSNDPSSMSSLRFALMGGESVGEAFLAFFSRITPHCEMGRSYGMTEMAGSIASTELTHRKNVNGGVLRNGCMVKIIDKDKNSLGPNQVGRVCLKTSAPFLGYMKNKLANEEAFIEGGWLNTGDLGMMDSDNLLNLSTREKYALQYPDGTFLMPNQVENIVNNFESVYSSALVKHVNVNNSKQDCGTIFVTLKNNKNSIYVVNDLRDYLRKKLTEKQMQIVKYFKIIEYLPQTNCCKVDRIILRDMVNGGYRIQ